MEFLLNAVFNDLTKHYFQIWAVYRNLYTFLKKISLPGNFCLFIPDKFSSISFNFYLESRYKILVLLKLIFRPNLLSEICLSNGNLHYCRRLEYLASANAIAKREEEIITNLG